MQDKPIDKDEILNELEEIHNLDYKYSDGRILGSMCTEAHPFAKEVYCKFLDTNLGDPGLFKGTKIIEDKVIKSIGKLLSLDDAYGNIVTGGTTGLSIIFRDLFGISTSFSVFAMSFILLVIGYRYHIIIIKQRADYIDDNSI